MILKPVENHPEWASQDGKERFLPGIHEYRVDEIVKIPSLSKILEENGLTDYSSVDRGVLQDAQLRGTAAHAGCEQSDKNDFDPESTDERTVNLVNGWKMCCRYKNWSNWTLIENPIIHSSLRYGCTPDRIKIWTEISSKREINHLLVVEIKATYKVNLVAVETQLSGQELAIKSCYPEMSFKCERWVVHLSENYPNCFKLIRCDRDRKNDFLSCLNTCNLREEAKR